MRISTLRAFLVGEAGGGLVLIAASIAALIIVNALPGGADHYLHLLHAPFGPALSPVLGPMTLHLWINDGLMAVFFLVVGLEIKREWLVGQLADPRDRVLPFLAAAAGMAVPALLYLALSRAAPDLENGWAIPAATDIAFALGVVALLGRRVPAALKLMLATIAIVDDMGAIAIIALAYTAGVDWLALAAAGVIIVLLMTIARRGVRAPAPYLLGFVALWYALLLSGVHATLAGVLTAATVPHGTLQRLEDGLHPWSAYVIVPLFGFANAGVVLPHDPAALFAPLPFAITIGLFVGKQIGIFGAIRLAVAAGIAQLPAGTRWAQIYGMAMLCGIGFTMSLFIAGLAFPTSSALVDEARIGILTGSLLSAVTGAVLLRFTSRKDAW